MLHAGLARLTDYYGNRVLVNPRAVNRITEASTDDDGRPTCIVALRDGEAIHVRGTADQVGDALLLACCVMHTHGKLTPLTEAQIKVLETRDG